MHVPRILAKFWRGPDKNEYEDIREYGAEFLENIGSVVI